MVTTAPCPDTPPAPGGRVAVICNVPVVSSSRCTSATACPSCDRKPPLETFTTCNSAGSYVICTGTEYTFCPPLKRTFTVNVDPLGCEMLGGSNTNPALPAEGGGVAFCGGAGFCVGA